MFFPARATAKSASKFNYQTHGRTETSTSCRNGPSISSKNRITDFLESGTAFV